MEEYLFLGLRKTDGISTEDFYERFGVSITDRFGEVVRRHEEEGLLAFDSQRMFLTKKGLDLSNYVLCDFL